MLSVLLDKNADLRLTILRTANLATTPTVTADPVPSVLLGISVLTLMLSLTSALLVTLL